MNRKILLPFVFSAMFFFIFLGMRNPDLHANHGPKQRPRAVVENVVKEFSSIDHHLTPAADVCPPLSLDCPARCRVCIARAERMPASIPSVSPASRAPPVISVA